MQPHMLSVYSCPICYLKKIHLKKQSGPSSILESIYTKRRYITWCYQPHYKLSTILHDRTWTWNNGISSTYRLLGELDMIDIQYEMMWYIYRKGCNMAVLNLFIYFSSENEKFLADVPPSSPEILYNMKRLVIVAKPQWGDFLTIYHCIKWKGPKQ